MDNLDEFAKKLQNEANETVNELSKNLIAVSAAMLIFSVALANIMSKNHQSIEPQFQWLCFLICIFCGVFYQMIHASRLHKHAGNLTHPEKWRNQCRDVNGMTVISTQAWKIETLVKQLQVVFFLGGVSLTGIGLII